MSMFSHAMFLETFQNVQRNVHENAKAKGFWDGPENNNVPTKLMLIVSELAEALEEHRRPKDSFAVRYVDEFGNEFDEQEIAHKDGKPMLKPEGFSIELADAVIRIMDLCEHLGIDLADDCGSDIFVVPL